MATFIDTDGKRRTVSATKPLPSSGGGSGGAVAGDVASGSADSGNPVKSGGRASSAIPSGVTAGQRVNQWYGLNGQTIIGMGDGAFGDGLDAGASLLPQAGGTLSLLGVMPMLMNPANSQALRPRGTVSGQFVIHKGGDNIATAQVAVTTSATLVAAARTGRQKITLTSSAAFWVGPAGVTSTTGFPAAAGAAITLDTAAAVYAVGSAAIPGSASAVELY